MRAMILDRQAPIEEEPLRMVDLPEPKPSDHQLLVRVSVCGACHTDLDEVEGRPNFEVVGVNGKVYKIQRGVPVKIPQSVLEVLNHAVAERIVQTHNPQGGVTSKRQKYTTVPFRVLQAL